MAMKWKVYNKHGDFTAQTTFAEEAACLAALLGDGCKVRFSGYSDGVTVWTEGTDGHAGDSYDAAAQTMNARAHELEQKWRAKVAARYAKAGVCYGCRRNAHEGAC